MNILLVGEYSRLHNSLKEGLVKLGHNVTILASGDGFKDYPVDIKISHSYNKGFLKKFKNVIYKIFKIDLASIETYNKAQKELKSLPKFDVVQLINESSIKVLPKYEIKFVEKLLEKTNNLYLLACGEDFITNSYLLANKPRYSFMSPYLEDNSLKKLYKFQFYCVGEEYKKLHDFLFNNIDGIIASDLDYHLPYNGLEKYLGLIPNPINTDKLKYIPLKIDDKIKIFHGVNTKSIPKKGNNYFFEALDIIQTKHADKVEIITAHSLPYNVYIEKYNSCHILLDQVYSYDQGYNALEAMAKGKVVFTGAEQEWLEYYNIKEDTVVINTLPDALQITKKLEWLILNPNKIIEISKNARNFIEKEHNYITIAKKYLDVWK